MTTASVGAAVWIFGWAILGQGVEAFQSPGIGSSPIPFRLLFQEEFGSRIKDLAGKFPEFIQLHTTNEDILGVPPKADMEDCPYDFTGKGCRTYMLTIQDFVAYPIQSQHSDELPEVFLNAAMHGDELLGPTSLLETVELLVEAASCEARPSLVASNRRQELFEAKLCRERLLERGIGTEERKWLARLVSTRRIVVLPIANELGFYQGRSLEGSIDPYIDFPFVMKDPTMCMKSMTARLLNEIFQRHMFQMVLSFQEGDAGTDASSRIEYSWASPTGHKWYGPDHKVQHQIAHALRQSLGDNSSSIGPLKTDAEVRGEFEDWSYAGSWYLTQDDGCTPQANDGYPRSKTIYNNSTNRAISMRITTGHKSHYHPSELGTTSDVFSRTEQEESALVARNVRTALATIDLVEPYASILAVDELLLSDDVVPQISQNLIDCFERRAILTPSEQKRHNIHVRWSVGGSINVASTELLYKKLDAGDESIELDCIKSPNALPEFMLKAEGVGESSGTGRLSSQGAYPDKDGHLNPTFEAKVKTKNFAPGDRILVVARAVVDQEWAQNGDEYYDPQKPPQSHLANVRTKTSSDWSHEHKGKQIKGQTEWYSTPVFLVISDDSTLASPKASFDRFAGSLDLYYDEGILKRPTSSNTDAGRTVSIILGIVIVLLLIIHNWKRRRFWYKSQQIVEAEMEDVRKDLEYRSNMSYTSSEASASTSKDYTHPLPNERRNVEVIDWTIPDYTFE